MQVKNDKAPALFAFVNVDGVLTSARTYWRRDGDETTVLDPIALNMLEHFCRELGIQVVMATAWSGMYKTPEAWQELFASKGADIPVVDVLDRNDDFNWLSGAKSYMENRPGDLFVLFEDNPFDVPAGETRVIGVDARVGLTAVNLLQAAQVLAPDSAIVDDLKSLNRSFGPNPTISFSINGGPELEVPLRSAGDAIMAAVNGRPL